MTERVYDVADEAFDLDELASMAWAVDHLACEHGYDAIRSRDGSRVDLKGLYKKILRRAGALGLTAGQEGNDDEQNG